MNKSEQINELAAALVKFHGTATNPKKNSTNPHFKSRYADLAEVISVSRIPLAECGLSIMQFDSFENGLVSVETMLVHISGQWISSVLSLPCQKQDAQGVGSALTYARRYSWSAICGLAQDDDDGNAAVSGNQQRQQPTMQKTPYTLEMAQAKAAEWVERSIPLQNLLAGIRSKHTLSQDVELFIKDTLEPGG